MFGKGGGPLNAWLREFCELVFIQTLQAFIFALIMGFIIGVMKGQTTMERSDRNSALGIICIVALTSIFKVEEIARRIFGFGPTKADHGNAVQSIGKGMMAFKMGKNLLDNGKKIVGGAGAFLGAHGQKVQAMKRYQKQLGALEADNKSGGQSSVKKSITLSSATGNKGNDEARKAKIAERDKLINDAKAKRNQANNKRHEMKQMPKHKNNEKKAKRNEDKEKLQREANMADAEADKLYDKAHKIQEELDAEESSANTSGSAPITITFDGGSGSGGSSRANNYNQKRLQYEEEYKAKIKDINKNKKQGVKTMITGFAETGAAMVGFTAGSAMSLASTNDFGQALSDGITTSGAADAVATGGVDLTFAVGDFVDNGLKNAGDLLGEYGLNVAAAYKESVAQMNQIDKDITAQTQKEMENMNKEAEQARDRAVKNASSSSGGSRAKGVGKAVIRGTGAAVKGVSRTVKGHSVAAQKTIIEQTKARVNASFAASSPSKDIDRNIYN